MSAVIRPNPQPLLRAMTMSDLDEVAAIEARAYAFPWTRGNFADSLAAGYFARLLEGAARDPIGYFIAMAGVGELHLLNITVDPRWQERGHGGLLLDALEDLARRSGLQSVWLEVRESNRRAQSLYFRRGFVQVGVRRRYYPASPGREDALVMRCTLDARGTNAVD
jgi:ribosomal-protein-alanine N-acetyltransferase